MSGSCFTGTRYIPRNGLPTIPPGAERPSACIQLYSSRYKIFQGHGLSPTVQYAAVNSKDEIYRRLVAHLLDQSDDECAPPLREGKEAGVPRILGACLQLRRPKKPIGRWLSMSNRRASTEGKNAHRKLCWIPMGFGCRPMAIGVAVTISCVEGGTPYAGISTLIC